MQLLNLALSRDQLTILRGQLLTERRQRLAEGGDGLHIGRRYGPVRVIGHAHGHGMVRDGHDPNAVRALLPIEQLTPYPRTDRLTAHSKTFSRLSQRHFRHPFLPGHNPAMPVGTGWLSDRADGSIRIIKKDHFFALESAMVALNRPTAYHEAAHAAVWCLEEGAHVNVGFDPPRVWIDPWPHSDSREELVRRAHVRTRASLAGPFAERYLLGDASVWLPSKRAAAPSACDPGAGDWHAVANYLGRMIGEHDMSAYEADALYEKAVADLEILFQDQIFTHRVRRIADYLMTAHRRLVIGNDELRGIVKGD